MPQSDLKPLAGSLAALTARVAALESELADAHAVLEAVRRGEIDALVVTADGGESQVYTLATADRPYRFLIEQMQEGAVTLTEDGTILYGNRRMADILGVPLQEITGQNLGRFLLPADASRFAGLLHDAKQSGVRDELTFRHAGARDIPVSLSLSPLLDGDTVLLGGVLSDVTTQKLRLAEETAERERAEAMLSRLRQVNSELDSFAYIASHDLKEPLRGINHSVSFLERSAAAKLTNEERCRIVVIKRLTQRMDHFTNSLLHYAQIGQAEIVLETVDMNELLQETLEIVASRITETATSVRVPRPLPTIRANPLHLGEMLNNLVVNALKYNEKPTGARWIEIGWRDQDGQLLFYVSDNGIGIAKQHLEDVFLIFRRLHDRDKYGGGNGAGLTIARRTVERLGGRLWAESDGPGKGATFLFSLNEHLVRQAQP